jgi:hypothetical protein
MSTQLSDIQPTSLRGWILKSLAQGEMLPNIAAVLLRPDRTEVNQKDETEYWDYKETIDLTIPSPIKASWTWSEPRECALERSVA